MKRIAAVLLGAALLVGCQPASRPAHPTPSPTPSIQIVCGKSDGGWRDCLKHMNDGH